ncbi:U3 small nucleolar RNA-associated protein 18 homolog [Sitodiplosis mosellana]|uniref:U3 small nucleolar RNA-associated protein 18 homolog n=1 Tax=Sitodiplosis mosellana TaxID=263140 RepID=UPI00244422C0|nr:U3 small nucleolar RNA-associated protein 18 homolog [Sitodiplosis mosellana]
MSDSESGSEHDYSNFFDDQEIKEENEEKPTAVDVKQELHDDDDDDDDDGDDNDSDGDDEDRKPELDVKKKKLSAKELRKLGKLREKQLKEDVFGNKSTYLKGLQTLADGVKKKKKSSDQKRKPVWNDDDDEGADVVTRVDNYKCEVTQKEVYKKQLENKFQRILGTPAWADLNRKKKDNDDSDDEILRTIGHIALKKGDQLVSGQLQFKKLKDLNRESYSEGPSITGVAFHPGSSVGLVSGTKGIATIYSIDGKKNDKLHSMEFKNFPIRCCRLSKDGSQAIFGGSQKYFYTYNLLSGHTQRVFLPKTITKMHNFEVSPCGKYVGVIGRFGEVHLLFANTFELLCTLKQEHDATCITFSNDSKYLFTHCIDNEVNIFDIGEQRFVHRFVDDGCINGSTISISPNGQLLAASSQQGVVNVYNYNDVLHQKFPRPQKTILNLTTAISSTTFNHTSELLAIASKEVEDAVRIVHFPSGTVYHNFPATNSGIGKPNVIQFSPQSGFLAIGNGDKQVPMYRLKHFHNF